MKTDYTQLTYTHTHTHTHTHTAADSRLGDSRDSGLACLLCYLHAAAGSSDKQKKSPLIAPVYTWAGQQHKHTCKLTLQRIINTNMSAATAARYAQWANSRANKRDATKQAGKQIRLTANKKTSKQISKERNKRAPTLTSAAAASSSMSTTCCRRALLVCPTPPPPKWPPRLPAMSSLICPLKLMLACKCPEPPAPPPPPPAAPMTLALFTTGATCTERQAAMATSRRR